MSLLDELAGLPLDQILQHLGPSLLTQPQTPTDDLLFRGPKQSLDDLIKQAGPGTYSGPATIGPDGRLTDAATAMMSPLADKSGIDTSTPVNIGKSAELTNADLGMLDNGYAPPRMGQPTQEQLLAQQAPMYKAGMPGGGVLQKILDAIAPVPEPYKQLLSGDEQRRMQLQSLGQIGGGLTGAYTRPGESQWFGQNLTRGMDASHQGMDKALEPTAQSVGLGNVLYQMHARQAVAQMYPKISDDPDEAQKQYLTMAQAAARAGLPEAKDYIGMANSIRDRSSGAGSDRVAPPEWSAAYDKAHPEPAPHTQDHVDWSYNKARQSVNDGYVTTASQLRTMADAERAQGNFKITSGQRDVALGQGQMRIADAETKAFEGRSDVKPIMAQVPAINMTQAVLDEAKKGNKAAYESVIGNFAQTVDQKAQLRTQMFEIMSRLDPSIKGRARIAFTRLMDGTWAPEDLAGVESVLKSVKAAKVRDYTTAYADYQKSHKDAHLVSPDVLFSTSPATSGLVGTPKY